jgi:putative Holliday junction resolvase
MRILGIDYGDRHIGLALTDALQITAQPLGTYTLSGRDKADRKFFRDLIARHEVSEIVLGNPLRMDGSAGTRAEKTREFADWLENTVGRPVRLVDERLTTKEALHLMRGTRLRGKEKKDREDQISAVIILSTYLESRRGGGP